MRLTDVARASHIVRIDRRNEGGGEMEREGEKMRFSLRGLLLLEEQERWEKGLCPSITTAELYCLSFEDTISH